MSKTRTVGNGEGSLYKDSKTGRYIYAYYYNGKRNKVKQKQNEKRPILLQKYMDSENYKKYNSLDYKDLLKEFNSEHYLSDAQFEFISKKLA